MGKNFSWFRNHNNILEGYKFYTHEQFPEVPRNISFFADKHEYHLSLRNGVLFVLAWATWVMRCYG